MISDLNKLAREIVEKNQYMTIASSDSQSNAWASPVVYTYDENHNFYFISLPHSKHCQNIQLKPKVTIAIFDSHQLYGEGVGLQIEGKANELLAKEQEKISSLYLDRRWPYGEASEAAEFNEFLRKHPYKFYKITPSKVWINDPNQKEDARVKVRLSN
jgi:uncharacterized protein YhbP (UPF0306 family)